MQTNLNEPIVTFSVPMSQDDVREWILEKAKQINNLQKLRNERDELQSKLEKLDEEIAECMDMCAVTVSA
ncbi:hypothetical protein ABN072_06340 [Providencia rettgeri]|uniref:hypothetical protein n=1 Tax=Providencia TaxID=586 RepID=UPI000807A6A3|nr:hypothetical protein [Providencia rettgeri]QIF57522.1 hypothetical protein FVA69_08635 [Providencia sp. 1701011]QIF61571.1 hypothetical protein FVA70_08650 [Providencia sp. 1701091]MBG5924869.1 hypothetical protein [Providencia rettgeri]MBS0859685.1 hypothetical protein [Providencia rettgeri]MBS0872972.1 hypothetical protein [Providencia rettgeri]